MDQLSITGEGMMKGDARQRVRAVANQLEGVFLKQLLAKLDSSPLIDEPLLGASNASKQFNELFQQALSEKAAGSMGLADSIFAQLASRTAIDPASKPSAPAAAPMGAKP